MEERVPEKHPLRRIRELVNTILEEMDEDFEGLYSQIGRESIAPEYLLSASILQILFTIRSERQLMEQIAFNLLFRWFVGLGLDDPVWDHSTFTKNRDRLLDSQLARTFFSKVVAMARKKHFLSNDHFTVDGTLIEAWAGVKSVQPKTDENSSGGGINKNQDFRGTERSNATHQSTTDPEARLYRKSKGTTTKLVFMGHILMENRNGLAVDVQVTGANGKAEREAAWDMVCGLPGFRKRTLGADKGYDAQEFADSLRAINISPHIASKTGSKSVDGRMTRQQNYRMSQRRRKRIEEIFGWAKTVGWMRKVKLRGQVKIDWMFRMCIAVFNLVRIRNLEVAV